MNQLTPLTLKTFLELIHQGPLTLYWYSEDYRKIVISKISLTEETCTITGPANEEEHRRNKGNMRGYLDHDDRVSPCFISYWGAYKWCLTNGKPTSQQDN
jgi:hypothetical protein